ncbi:M14 family metallopeptidase [Paenibacillus turpanensis]|uniref:M14 family metallopeptidase n=1 Tax=Paenibacillus turpanensis TaxID=2689078 RepID=UPI00140DC699|nr:M14 family zinc carboxypeptidase [Paenibacillus turpanensis]
MKIRFRQGDTLWLYSRWFDIPLQLIIDSNPILDPALISPGEQVEIPGFIDVAYRVAPGDTLWQIAASKGTSVDLLMLLNPGVTPQTLTIGQVLRVPVRVTAPIVQGARAYDYAAMVADLNRLVEIYPFLRRRSIGSSVMGKRIPEVRIGRGSKKIHVNGSFHAHEWITTPVLMRFLNEYVLALTNQGAIRGLAMEPLYQGTELSLVPMVNPDGVNLVVNGLPEEQPYRNLVLSINGGRTNFSGWKANIRGIDLNDQFPALWELEAAQRTNQPAPRDYPGTAPLTEPEAEAMAALTRAGGFERVLAFHTQGKVIYWGFEGLQPPEAEIIVNEFARVSGYIPVEGAGSYAGYKDWFIQDFRRPGYTVELGRGVNPLPITQFEEIYQESLGILLASLYM